MQSNDGARLHLAIIMGGNGRWATRRGLPRVAGHRIGVTDARSVAEHTPDVGIRRLTLYAFPSDNWRRLADEVKSIFWLLLAFLRLETLRLKKRGTCLEVMGRRDRLPSQLQLKIVRAEYTTGQGSCPQLRVAIDYSWRDAIARALAGVTTALCLGTTHFVELVGRTLAQAMTAESGEVDLMIRTGGEKRLSDFLLWDSAHAELVFTVRMWPEFDAAQLDAALGEFRRRERCFGRVPAAPAHSALFMTGGSR